MDPKSLIVTAKGLWNGKDYQGYIYADGDECFVIFDGGKMAPVDTETINFALKKNPNQERFLCPPCEKTADANPLYLDMRKLARSEKGKYVAVVVMRDIMHMRWSAISAELNYSIRHLHRFYKKAWGDDD